MKFKYDQIEDLAKELSGDQYAEKAELIFLPDDIVLVAPRKKKSHIHIIVPPPLQPGDKI